LSAAPPAARGGSLLSDLPSAPLAGERFDDLLARPDAIVRRIVSTGQATAPGTWYDQDDDEWVMVVQGHAGVAIEGEAAIRILGPGDWLFLPAHLRHRVVWTDSAPPTVWLALHLPAVRG
jgi:cupin 2 domain-containing protein